jgi:DNA-binding SARP family transcriptional activator/class 3 adenylate cyclase
VEFLVLGPLEVVEAGSAVPLGGPKERSVLAVLLLHANHVVSTDRLVEEVWAQAGDGARRSVHVHVSALRKRLDPSSRSAQELLATVEPGYVIRLAASQLDSLRFEAWCREGSDALARGEFDQASRRLADALALWRGPVLADLADQPFVAPGAARLEALRLDAAEARFEAELAAGRNAQVVAELEAAVQDNPRREKLWAQLMLALYRCGRQSEALRACGRLRRILAEELGIDPSPELAGLEEAILLHKPELDGPGLPVAGQAAMASLAPVASSVPLPSGVVTFLLTDVEGSTRLWEAHAADMAVALPRHDQIMATAVGDRGGVVLKARGEGDSTFSVFARASDAATAALAAQRALADEPWPPATPLSVRMALYTGEALERDRDYYGRTVNRAARLRGLASGGQILVSQATAEVIRDHLGPEVRLIDLGAQPLPGIDRPEQVLALATAAAAPKPVLTSAGSHAASARSSVAAGRRLVAMPGIRITHKEAVHAVAFSPGGSLLATGSDDGTARVVEARTGNEVARVTHPRPVRAVAFSPDGSLLATGSFDGTARVVEARTGNEVARVRHTRPVRAVAFSPDGSLLATGSDDATARVVEARTGNEFHSTKGKEVLALAFSPDGSLLATGSFDGTARVVEARTGNEVARVTHTRPVRAVAFSPDGLLLATGSGDGTARVVEERTGNEVARVTHTRLVRAVAFNPDGSLLATGSFDATARVLELRVEN